MTVSRISSACWAMVAIMTLAIWPAASAVMNVHAAPVAIRVTLTVVLAAAGWLSPFCYALYLRHVVLRHGDRALLERGMLGTARVLSARRTAEVNQSGESGWHAPWVHEYVLLVSLPGRAPYRASCRLNTPELAPGSTVPVAASPRNRQRVTIDIGQAAARPAAPAVAAAAATLFR